MYLVPATMLLPILIIVIHVIGFTPAVHMDINLKPNVTDMTIK